MFCFYVINIGFDYSGLWVGFVVIVVGFYLGFYVFLFFVEIFFVIIMFFFNVVFSYRVKCCRECGEDYVDLF